MKLKKEIKLPVFTIQLPFIMIEWECKENKINIIFSPFNLIKVLKCSFD